MNETMYPSYELPLTDSTPAAKPRARSWGWLRRGLLLLAIVVVVLAVTHTLWLPRLFAFLDVSQSPHQADFIVMLGSGVHRAQAAAKLYQEGYASRIIVSGCEESLPADLQAFKEAGVPDDVLIINGHATDTWDESQQILDLLYAEGATSALVVTDAGHSRRARATYQHFLTGQSVALTFVAAPVAYGSEDWWRSSRGVNTVLSEYVKGLYYAVRYGISFL